MTKNQIDKKKVFCKNFLFCIYLTFLFFSISCEERQNFYSVIAYNNSESDLVFKITDAANMPLNSGYLKQAGTAGTHNIHNDLSGGIVVSWTPAKAGRVIKFDNYLEINDDNKLSGNFDGELYVVFQKDSKLKLIVLTGEEVKRRQGTDKSVLTNILEENGG